MDTCEDERINSNASCSRRRTFKRNLTTRPLQMQNRKQLSSSKSDAIHRLHFTDWTNLKLSVQNCT